MPGALVSLYRYMSVPCKNQEGSLLKILIDINLQYDLLSQIMVERNGFALVVELEYEKLLQFCSLCRAIDPSLLVCKHNIIGRKVKRNHWGTIQKRTFSLSGR